KGLNKQGGGLSAPVLTRKDRADIKAAAALGLDFLAVSFAREARDIEKARSLLEAVGGKADIVAKIERAEAVENIESIIDVSDIIMVARGDLAVEVGYAAMTSLQKRLIHLTRSRNKISITATQMLESMIQHLSPTRAEASDVANAVMDGTDAVMLSAETAAGKYPVRAVQVMSELCLGAEKHEIFLGAPNYRLDDVFEYADEAIAMAVMYTANHLDVSAIVALTESGSTSRWMSRVRSNIPIYACTRHADTRRRVAIQRGVYPVPFHIVHADSFTLHQTVFNTLIDRGAVSPSDLLLLTKGEMEGISGGTNTMQILKIPKPTEDIEPEGS
ncbi:MAG: pyruvate kinase, partial [Dehalococcoidia bacterium]|nr:pyruvate kinase [Dehalococcoidia bacterium]